MMTLPGCHVEALDDKQCRRWLGFFHGEFPAPSEIQEPAWGLCHCDDGVTWARYEDGIWMLGSAAFPDLCPEPTQENLQELRIFHKGAEIFMWRFEDGLRGRVFRDVEESMSKAVSPKNETRPLLFGPIVHSCKGFTLVSNGAGMQHALPLSLSAESPWPCLGVRHYFSQDEQTGRVRVIASRLFEVK